MNETNKTFSEQIANTDAIIALYFIQLLLFAIAASCSICFLLLSKRLNVFHANLRILLVNIVFAYGLASIIQIISTIQILSLFFSKTEGLLQNRWWCESIKAIFYITLSVPESGLIALVIERSIATKTAKIYEKINNHRIGLFLVVSQV
jgi:hypothetical protein